MFCPVSDLADAKVGCHLPLKKGGNPSEFTFSISATGGIISIYGRNVKFYTVQAHLKCRLRTKKQLNKGEQSFIFRASFIKTPMAIGLLCENLTKMPFFDVF